MKFKIHSVVAKSHYLKIYFYTAYYMADVEQDVAFLLKVLLNSCYGNYWAVSTYSGSCCNTT